MMRRFPNTRVGVCLLAFAFSCIGTSVRAADAPAPGAEAEQPAVIDVDVDVVDVEAGDEEDAGPIDVSIVGPRASIPRLASPAHIIDKEQLEMFEDDNVQRSLRAVTGVYVRGEDGYGLRPNIGLRGGSSDRSKKINLLEDGILLGPAPYAAPAAYYFPLSTRMVALEVFKGASAIRHGPNSIGGTLNMVSRQVPYGHVFGADLAYGTENYGKLHGYYGYGDDYGGALIEVVRLRSNGFKQLDAPDSYGSRPNTGFDKVEVMGKARINTDPIAAVYHEAQLKLGYSREISNETYLGLSDSDFAANPLRRYAASQLDRMQWDRTALEIAYGMALRGRMSLKVVAYRHDFDRSWRRLNRFGGNDTIADVLSNPQDPIRGVLYQTLTGAQDTTGARNTLMVVTNARKFVSQGVQLDGNITLPSWGPLAQRLRFGARFHHDQIKRNHTEHGFLMRSGAMLADGNEGDLLVDNTGRALALAAYLLDEVTLGDLVMTPGIRVESIYTRLQDRSSGVTVDGRQRVMLPGMGAMYTITPEFGVLAGVHQGFSPLAPGHANELKPEVAVNYEAGARYTTEPFRAEAIGFFNNYSNLTRQCTNSSGCSVEDLDSQSNAGNAFIYGVEASVNLDLPVADDWRIPLGLNYTFTRTELRSDFVSDDPQLGVVQAGDEIPYVPTHQAAVSAGVIWADRGSANIAAAYTDRMRELAGQGPMVAGETTDAQLTVDATIHARLAEPFEVYLKMENLFNQRYLVSRRPFGARPTRPRFFYAGLKVNIDRP